MKTRVDCMTYYDGMEDVESDILGRVLKERGAYDPDSYKRQDVLAALTGDRLDIRDFGALISTAAESFLEQMAERAKAETARFFGNGIRLYTPLYIANHCVNQCAYCGFNSNNKILRGKLTPDEISRELDAIAATGLDEILILTGESREKSSLEYIGQAVAMAARVFGAVGLEIYPISNEEYAFLHNCGADFVSVYQETYDIGVYESVHPDGPKRCFPYRFNSQERAILGGMRGVSFGALFGLGDPHRDAFSAGLHAYLLQKKYPHAEIALSVPRMRTFDNRNGNAQNAQNSVGERLLMQFMLAYRLFMPYAGITISTRERPAFRDAVSGMCATRISAGVCVGVGGHESEKKGGEQFMISDARSVKEIHSMLRKRGLQPVYTDYIRV